MIYHNTRTVGHAFWPVRRLPSNLDIEPKGFTDEGWQFSWLKVDLVFVDLVLVIAIFGVTYLGIRSLASVTENSCWAQYV